MLSISNTDISETRTHFRENNLKVAFLVPTKTGLKKSTLDATSEFREFLSLSNVHDFTQQAQGPENKMLLDTTLISENTFIETKTSFYRPKTKQGDPRVCVYRLGKHASEGDLLAFLAAEDRLIVINTSNSNLIEATKAIFEKFLNIQLQGISNIAEELRQKMEEIAKRGFIKTLRSGDTGVGYTLETLLGIKSNSSKNPDYKGIELKSSRQRNPKGTMFSMVPDWTRSNLTDKELIEKRGYYSPDNWGSLKSLHQTLTTKRNGRNLKLELHKKDIYGGCEQNNKFEKDVVWSQEDLKARIAEKHKETFWIEVETRNSGNNEEFKYKQIIHTSNADLSMVPIMLRDEMISLDYILWEKGPNWKNYTKKSGFDYLWKVKKKHVDTLFKFIKTYHL